MTDPIDLDTRTLLAGYALGSLSPSSYTDAVIAHIDAWEPHLHALYAYAPERARQAAAASTRRWRDHAPCGPLDGVPVTLKELTATRGTPMPLGTAAPDYGMLSSGLSSFHALARNPWDLATNPGGSVRLPAAWCGLVGLRPILGRVPIDPSYVCRCAGPRTFDDATSLPPEAIDGFNRTFELRRCCAALFEQVDAVLSPTTPNLAFPAEWASPLDDPQHPFEHIAFTLPWNMSEQPAVSLNCGFSDAGTPIGLQIVTRRFADLQALQLARWFEARRDPINWPRPPS